MSFGTMLDQGLFFGSVFRNQGGSSACHRQIQRAPLILVYKAHSGSDMFLKNAFFLANQYEFDFA